MTHVDSSKLSGRFRLPFLPSLHALAVSVGATLIASCLTSGLIIGNARKTEAQPNAASDLSTVPSPAGCLRQAPAFPVELPAPDDKKSPTAVPAVTHSVSPRRQPPDARGRRTARRPRENPVHATASSIASGESRRFTSAPPPPSRPEATPIDMVLPAAEHVVRSGWKLVASAGTLIAAALPALTRPARPVEGSPGKDGDG